MSTSPGTTHDHAILKALADAPGTAKTIADQLGLPVLVARQALHDMVARGLVHACSGHRYWVRSEHEALIGEARRIIAAAPTARKQLLVGLRRLGTGASEAYLDRVVDEIRVQPDVHVWPRQGQHKADRYSTRAPDLSHYLSRVRSELDPIISKLGRVGVAPSEVCAFLFPNVAETTRQRPSPPPEPRDEGDRDFHREMSVELVFAWEDAAHSPLAQELIARVMQNMGLQRLGETGVVVSYEGIKHDTDDDLVPGDPAVVTTPGWQLLRGTKSRVVSRAKVRAAEGSA